MQRNFSCQTGDPIGPDSPDSDGGSSIWGILNGASQKNFQIDFPPKLKHVELGTVSLATVPSPRDPDKRLAGSQFIISLGEDLEYLNDKAVVFGRVVEGFDALDKINTAFVDDKGRPLKDIRLRHTIILDDPFEDLPGMVIPPESPLPSKAQLATVMIADDEQLDEQTDGQALEELRREREARAQALTLEMVGDLPFAEVKPPENVLFVCKLNPVTQGMDPQDCPRYHTLLMRNQMRTYALFSVGSGRSYPVKLFGTRRQVIASNMRLLNSKTKRTANRRILKCKGYLLMTIGFMWTSHKV